MSRFYRFLDNAKHPTRVFVIHANSKDHAAQILNRPLGHIAKHLHIISSEHAEKYRSLPIGDYSVADDASPSKGLRVVDIDRIAALGYLKSAKKVLQDCELKASEKDRLNIIIAMIDDLRVDVSDRLLEQYKNIEAN